MSHLDLAVSIYHSPSNSLQQIYEGIPDLETAHLLAQYAMNNKKRDDLVVIMPGWYKNLSPDLIKKAEKLAEEYAAGDEDDGR